MGPPGRHGHARAPRNGTTSKAWGWRTQEAFQETWSHTWGLLRENWRDQGFFGDTWPYTGTLKGGGFMQKLGSHIPLETKTETSPRVSVSPWSE